MCIAEQKAPGLLLGEAERPDVPEALNDGHCGLLAKELHTLAEKLLEVPVPIIDTAIALELGEGSIVQDSVEGTGCIYLTGLHQTVRLSLS